MATSVVLTGKFVGSQQIQAALKQVEGGLGNIEKRSLNVTASLDKLGRRLTSVGKTLSVSITAPLIAGATALSKFAIDTVESENLFEQSLGNMADDARRFSDELSKSLGLNEFEMRRQIGVLFTMTQSMGITEDAALSMAEGISLLAQDMASFRNISPEVAFEKLQSAITGEIEPLRRLGINISQNLLEQEALRHGIEATSQEMSEQLKIALRWSAILRQTANDQTDLARTLESPANQLRILGQRAKTAGIVLGQSLLPAISLVLEVAGKFAIQIKGWIDQFNALEPRTKGMVIAIGGLVAAFGPLLIVIGKAIQALKLFGVALVSTAGRVTIIITALASLAAFLTALTRDFDAFIPSFEAIFLNMERIVTVRIQNILAEMGVLIPGFDSVLTRVGQQLSEIDARLKQLDAGQSLAESFAGVAEETIRQLDPEIKAVGDFVEKSFGGIFERLGGINRETDVAVLALQGISPEAKSAVNDLKSIYADLIAENERLVQSLAGAGGVAGAAGGVDALGLASAKAAEFSKILRSELEKVAGSISDVNQRARGMQDALSDLELQRLEFRIDLGEAEIPEKIAALQDRLVEAQKRAEEAVVESQAIMDKARELSADKSSEVAKRIMDDAMAISQGLEREAIRQQETALRTQEAIADAFEEMAREQIEGLGKITMANAAAAKMQLEQWRRFYEQQGELATKGAEVVKEKSAEVTEQVNADIKAMADEAISNVQAINKSFGDLFADVLVDGADFKEGFISIIRGLGKDLISTGIQNILGGILTPGQPQQQSQVGGLFSVLGGLFGGGGQQQQAPGGRAGGVGGVGVGGGFGAAGVPFPLPGVGPSPLSILGLGGPIGAGLGAGALLLPFLGPITDAIGGFGKGLLNVFSGGADAIGGIISGFGSGLQSVFSSGLGGLGSVLTNFVSGLTDALSSIIPGFGGLLGGGGFLGGIGNIFGSIGSLFGGLFQHGGSFVTQGPTLIGVGEVAERVTVTPLGGRAARDGNVFNFNGPLFMDEVSAVNLEKLMQRAVRSGAGSTI